MIWRIYPLSMVAGLLTSGVIGFLVGTLAVAPLILTGPDAAVADILLRGDVRIALLITSILSFLAAGFVAARFAPGEELVNACATGILILLIGAAEYDNPVIDPYLPAWLDLLSLGLAVPTSIAGGLLWSARARSSR